MLKKLRLKNGYTQEEVARILNITLRNYQKIEKNFPEQKTNIITGLKIAALYKINPFKLWGINKNQFKN